MAADKICPFSETRAAKRKTQAACERPAIRWMIKQERFAVRFAAAAAAAAAASASDLKFSFSSVEIRFSWKTDIFRFFSAEGGIFLDFEWVRERERTVSNFFADVRISRRAVKTEKWQKM